MSGISRNSELACGPSNKFYENKFYENKLYEKSAILK